MIKFESLLGLPFQGVVFMIFNVKTFFCVILFIFLNKLFYLTSYGLYQLPETAERISCNINAQAGIIFACMEDSGDTSLACCAHSLLRMKREFLSGNVKADFLSSRTYLRGVAAYPSPRGIVAIAHDERLFSKLSGENKQVDEKVCVPETDFTYIIQPFLTKAIIFGGDIIFMDGFIKEEVLIFGGRVAFLNTWAKQGIRILSGSVISINSDTEILENIEGKVLYCNSKVYGKTKMDNVRYIRLKR